MGCKKHKFIEKFNQNKVLTLSIIFAVLLIVSIAIPTLSEYKIASPTYDITEWDGTVADGYSGGNGELTNPYIISNGNELAYLANQLETNNYEGKYFILNNDIILNEGIFTYDKEDGIKYLKDNSVTPSEEIEKINIFKHLNGFKGNFDGKNHTIYGLYIDEAINEQNALFTNLEGNISNLYIKNSIIYGGKITAGVASKATNSQLTNISYNGYVISNEEIDEKEITLELEDIIKNTNESEETETINISNIDYIPGIITEITLSGYLEDDQGTTLKIANQTINAGKFELTLDNKLTNIEMIYQTENGFNLSDLLYKIKYKYSNAAGIVSIAENTTLKNIINKANVYASVYSSGIINTAVGNTTIENTYNTGIIESIDTSSGLISNINQNEENISITNCYNSGNIISNNSSLIGNIENNTGTISLNNVFNTVDSYGINLIETSTVTINNSYLISDKYIKTGTSTEEFKQTTLEELKTKAFVQEELNYQEYIENNPDNVWIWNYESDSLPILYIDELTKPIANIHLKEYIWNSYKTELNTLNLSDNLVFSIEQTNELNPIKELYYYLSNEKTALTKETLDNINEWNNYEQITKITEEGFYVIYVKAIDYNNNEIYLNTDLLILDLTEPNVTISSSFTPDTWSIFKTNLNNYYIEQEVNITIQSEDSLSGINKTYYYISDSELSLEDINAIEDWNEYTEEISISSKKAIIYTKVIDNCNHITYANTDFIIFNGYTLSNLSPGLKGETTNNLSITDKSSISMNFIYQDVNSYQEGDKHQLISSVLLPKNTKITLIDKIKNKVYQYVTTDFDYGYNCTEDKCEAKYDFELFNEVGSKNKFQESNYSGIINEEFIVIVDFANTQITKNYQNILIALRLYNQNDNQTRNTLLSSIKEFNIISENSHAYFTLTSDFEGTINYNENKQYIIDFTTKLNYKTLEETKIFDTTYEDKYLGLSIKMVDNKGNIVDKQYLKSISFKLGDKKYSPSSDGIVRINLENGINDITDNLIIQTYTNNYSLETGDYKFIISLYTSYDGIYSNELHQNIEIPIYVGITNNNTDNNFNVVMNNQDKIITTKKNEFDFEFLVGEITENTNIKISLYKKEKLSPYDQNYTIIDLGDYLVDNQLETYADSIYYASKNLNNNSFKLNINTGTLEKNGYMFVFELYDGERLVNKISKKFIIK